MKKKTLLISGLASVVILSTTFLGYTAVSASEPTNHPILTRVAQILNIKEGDLTNAFKQAKIEEINKKVESGELNEEKAQEIIERIENSEGFIFGRRKGQRGNPRAKFIRPAIKDIMDFLGIEKQEAIQYREEGKTLAQVAEEKGVAYEVLKNFVIDLIKQSADKGFEEGIIDKEKKDLIYEHSIEKAEFILNNNPQNSGFRGRNLNSQKNNSSGSN